MALFDDNKEGWQKYLASVFGLHVTNSHLIAHREEFVGAQGEKQFTLDLVLGDGASVDEDGEGRWNGIAFVYYKGRKLEEGTDWRFYPGTPTTGTADPVQGEDPWFPGGGVYSGSARLTIKLPPGVADGVDTSGLDIIPRGIECGDYDAAGNRTGISYTTNPARVKVFALKRAGKLAYINWPQFVAARDYNDGMLDWEAGDNTHTFSVFVGVPTYDASGNIAIVTGTGAASKPSAVDAYDNRAVTRERIVAGEDGYFEITIGAAFPDFTGGGEVALTDANGIDRFRICWGNAHLSVFANEVPYDDYQPPYELPAAAGDSIRLTVSGGFFGFEQNGVAKPIPQGVAPVPDVDLFGKILLQESSATISASEFSGQTIDTTTPVITEVKRFEAHPAFTAPTDLPTVLDFVDLLAAADTRMNAGRVEFLTAEPRALTFTLDDQVNLDSKQPVRVFEKPPGERPTQLFGFLRDTSDKYLREKPVSDVREQLFNDLGSHTRVGPLNFGSMPESQGQRLIKFEMRKRSDRKQFVECVGMPSTYRILVGDTGTLLTRELKRVPLTVIVLKATRDPASGKRQFTLREYKPDDYSDDDHGHTQQAGSIAADPSSTVQPPSAPVLRLKQVTDYSVGGALVTKVRGTIYFPVHPSPLRAKVFVTKPVGGAAGTLEEDAGVGLISPAAGTNQGQFDFVADAFGPYTFRVQVETATSSPVPGGETSEEIDVTNVVRTVPDPQALVMAVNGQQILYTITAPATTPEVVDHYQISKTNIATPLASDIVYSGSSLNGTEAFSGTLGSSTTRYVRAIDAMGNKSNWVSGTYNGASLAAPTLAALSSSGQSAEYSITPNGATNTALIAKTIVEVATANTFGGTIVLTREFTGAAPSTGSITLGAGTYYIRARYVDQTGTAGTNSSTASFTLTGAGIGGSTGGADNAVLRADGTGGATLQNSAVTIDDNGAVTVPEIAAPATPGANKVVIYAKSDGKLYIKDDAGTETDLTAVGGGGGGSGAVQGIVQGRLTTETGVAVSTSDRTAQSTIYFTPFRGNQVALYGGSSWALYTFTERSLALTSLTSGKNYDVFLYNNAGTLTLELSAAWTNDTTRADALALQDGVYVKSADHTRLYLGTIRTTGTTTTEDSGGGSTSQVGGKRFVWNFYNQVSRTLALIDTTDTWSYTTGTWRQANNAAGNKVEVVIGLTYSPLVEIRMLGGIQVQSNGSALTHAAQAVGVDSTTAPSGHYTEVYNHGDTMNLPLSGEYRGMPGSGYHYFAWIERGITTGSSLFFGDESGNAQSGLTGTIWN
jgi:hypothetical protein